MLLPSWFLAVRTSQTFTMILRTCAFLCLLSLAAAQTGEPSAEVPTDAMTMTEDMMDDMTDAPMTDAPMTDAPPTTSFMPNLTAQYANLNASEQRRRHFYVRISAITSNIILNYCVSFSV